MIPVGILASSGATAIPLTSVDFFLYGGGSGNGGSGVVHYTNQALQPGTTRTITIGAAYGSSSYDSFTASSSNISYNLNGSITSYWQGNGFYNPGGWQYPYYYYSDFSGNGGTPGAGGNGSNATMGSPNFYQGGYGGAPRTAYSVAGSTIPSAVGAGGGGSVFPSSVMVYNDMDGSQYYMYGYPGSYFGPTGANTGNGETFSREASGSGGFILRYPSTLPPLSATTGTVEITVNSGIRYYFWKSSGSFTV